MKGPTPMPTKMKILTGNRGKRPLNDKEPEPETTIPERPPFLKSYAAKEWDRITPELEKLGLISAIDLTALAAYCQLYHQWVMCQNDIRKRGFTLKAKTGVGYTNPNVGTSMKLLEKMTKLMCEFGMTPASRTRVKVEKPKKEDDGFDI